MNGRYCSWGNVAPDCCAFTLFRLEIAVHIPPPLGIPLDCVTGFASDAAVLAL